MNEIHFMHTLLTYASAVEVYRTLGYDNDVHGELYAVCLHVHYSDLAIVTESTQNRPQIKSNHLAN